MGNCRTRRLTCRRTRPRIPVVYGFTRVIHIEVGTILASACIGAVLNVATAVTMLPALFVRSQHAASRPSDKERVRNCKHCRALENERRRRNTLATRRTAGGSSIHTRGTCRGPAF